MIKLLIDECLTPDLVDVARARWFEASHVARIGHTSAPDRLLIELAINSDLAFVTSNARDFRRLYKKVELHPGLLIILPQLLHDRQITAFRKLLDHLEAHPDIVNHLVQIDELERITVTPWSSIKI